MKYEVVHRAGCRDPRARVSRISSGVDDRGWTVKRTVLICTGCNVEVPLTWPSTHPHKPACTDQTVVETVELPHGGPMRTTRRCRGCGAETTEEDAKAVVKLNERFNAC